MIGEFPPRRLRARSSHAGAAGDAGAAGAGAEVSSGAGGNHHSHWRVGLCGNRQRGWRVALIQILFLVKEEVG